MLRKCLLIFVAVISLFLGALSAFAQTGQLRGHVLLQQADGTKVPAAEAAIDVYRLDLPGKYPTKANKKGEFVFAGLPYVGNYVITASLPNARPIYQSNVKVGRDIDYELTLSPGDGSRLTLDQIKAAIGGGGAPSGGGGESVTDKAKREELLRKNAEIATANKKAGEINEIVGRTFKLGNEAFKAKSYDEAIRQYKEGLAADAEQPSLLTNLSGAQRARGVDRYNVGVRNKDDALRDSGIQDFRDAADAGTKAVEFLKKQTAATTPEEQTKQTANKYFALAARAEAMRLVATKVDQTQADAAAVAFQEYIAAETDAVKKKKSELDAARMLFDAGAADKARVEFKKILAVEPNNVDALYWMGLTDINLGYAANDKSMLQEGVNYLQSFVDAAPDTHEFKADAKAVIANMKSTEKVEPVRSTPARRRRP